MTILHLPESFFPANGGGKEVYTLRFAQALQLLGTKNFVAIHGSDSYSEKYDYEGIEVRRLPALKHHTLYINRYSRTVDIFPGFGGLLDELKPDIVHFHDQNNGASLSHLREVKRRGIKTVVTFHTAGQVCPQHALLFGGKSICDGHLDTHRCTACQLQSFFALPQMVAALLAQIGVFTLHNPKGKLAKLLAHRSMTNRFIDSYHEFVRLADKTIVFTQWAKETYLSNGIAEDKISVIDTGGNPSIPYPSSVDYRAGDVLQICYIGRCEYIKGIHLLIAAVKQLESCLPIKIFIYSHSWENTVYGRSMLQEIKGDSRFEAPRMVNNADLAQTIAKHHVCVIPSICAETGPLTVFDSFGAGLPIIGSNCGGTAERVRDGIDGLLFENSSVDDLREKIEFLAKHPEQYAFLRNNIRPNRTMADVAKETLELYSSL
jgi:glycosyltransferase involved in cell wall biosynthesis